MELKYKYTQAILTALKVVEQPISEAIHSMKIEATPHTDLVIIPKRNVFEFRDSGTDKLMLTYDYVEGCTRGEKIPECIKTKREIKKSMTEAVYVRMLQEDELINEELEYTPNTKPLALYSTKEVVTDLLARKGVRTLFNLSPAQELVLKPSIAEESFKVCGPSIII